MSKKSRKRNKKILAAIGIGLGAAALASRKPKQSSTEANSGKDGDSASAESRRIANKKTDYITKKDTAVKPIAKDTNKGSGSNVRTRQKIVNSSGDTVASAGTAIADNKSKVTGILPPSQNTNMYSKAGDKNPRRVNRKDGGRMGLKSGGSSVKKSMGKALRGGGKVIR